MSDIGEIIDKNLRDKRICEAYANGKTVGTIVKEYQLKRQTIYAILKKNSVKTNREVDTALTSGERNLLISAAYLAGEPMPSIASTYGMTRQGVQLILKKMGYTGKDGGAQIRSSSKVKQTAIENELKKDSQCLLKWGCTLEQWKYLRGMHADFNHTPIARFIQHRSNVLKKNILWTLSLWNWWTIWSESGLYPKRGRDKDCYCMVRKYDTGCYEVGNVEIIPVLENIQRRNK